MGPKAFLDSDGDSRAIISQYGNDDIEDFLAHDQRAKKGFNSDSAGDYESYKGSLGLLQQ
jgi:hypothetical protein